MIANLLSRLLRLDLDEHSNTVLAARTEQNKGSAQLLKLYMKQIGKENTILAQVREEKNNINRFGWRLFGNT